MREDHKFIGYEYLSNSFEDCSIQYIIKIAIKVILKMCII